MRPPPLAIGAGAGLAAALLLAPATGTAIGTLAAARAERARLAALAAEPAAEPVIAAPGLGLGADDPAAGRAAIMARVQGLAKAGGVLVEETSAASAPAALVALRIRVSGAEKAVIAFADTLERGRPLMRLRSWRIEPIPGGVRLIGEVLALVPDKPANASRPPAAAPIVAGNQPPLARVYERQLFGAAEPEAAPADAPALIGIVGRLGADAVALVRASDGKTRTLRIGESADGWSLASLAINAAFFTRGTERVRVPLPIEPEPAQ